MKKIGEKHTNIEEKMFGSLLNSRSFEMKAEHYLGRAVLDLWFFRHALEMCTYVYRTIHAAPLLRPNVLARN